MQGRRITGGTPSPAARNWRFARVSRELRDALEESVRDDDWILTTVSIDIAVDIFWYLGDARAAAVLAGAVQTTQLRWPYVAIRGPGLAVRTANLARARETLGDTCYEQAWAEGVTMSRQDALAFALQHL
jgi:hypothetical protein